MSQLFVIPLVQTTLPGLVDAQGNPIAINVPEYSVNDTDPLYGAAYTCMPLTGAGIALVATAPNSVLAAESDVFAFPADLTAEMSDSDITALSTVLQNANVPTDFLVSPITYAQAARTIGQIAQTLQQAAGGGSQITLGGVRVGASQGVGEVGGSGSTLLATAAQWTAPLILGTDVTL
jgi:hypothetical protein